MVLPAGVGWRGGMQCAVAGCIREEDAVFQLDVWQKSGGGWTAGAKRGACGTVVKETRGGIWGTRVASYGLLQGLLVAGAGGGRKKNSARRRALRMEVVRRKMCPHSLHRIGGGGREVACGNVCGRGAGAKIQVSITIHPPGNPCPAFSTGPSLPCKHLCRCGLRFKAVPWSRAYRTLHSSVLCAVRSCWLSSSDVSSAAKACIPDRG